MIHVLIPGGARFIGSSLADSTVHADDFRDDEICALFQAVGIEEQEDEVINIGSEKGVTILELAELIIRLTESDSKVEFRPSLKEGDMSRRQPDASKMKAILGKDLMPLDVGIRKILDGDLHR